MHTSFFPSKITLGMYCDVCGACDELGSTAACVESWRAPGLGQESLNALYTPTNGEVYVSP